MKSVLQKPENQKALPRKGTSFWIVLLALALLLGGPGVNIPQYISLPHGDVEASVAPRSDAVHRGLPERDLNIRLSAEVPRLAGVTGPGSGADEPQAIHSDVSLILTRRTARYRAPVSALPYGVQYARIFHARAPPHRAA